MAINASVQCNGGLLPDIILSTLCYYHRGIRLNAMKRFCLCNIYSHPDVLPFFPPVWEMIRRFRCVQTFLSTALSGCKKKKKGKSTFFCNERRRTHLDPTARGLPKPDKKLYLNGVTSGQQYNIGEKSTFILLYTYINHHVGTPKQKETSYYPVHFELRVPDYGTVTFYREIKLKLGFGIVHCCYYVKIYLQLIDMGGLRLQRARSPR